MPKKKRKEIVNRHFTNEFDAIPETPHEPTKSGGPYVADETPLYQPTTSEPDMTPSSTPKSKPKSGPAPQQIELNTLAGNKSSSSSNLIQSPSSPSTRWEKMYDANLRAYYFYNHASGLSQWEQPPDYKGP